MELLDRVEIEQLVVREGKGALDRTADLEPPLPKVDDRLEERAVHDVVIGDRCLARVSGIDRRGRREGAIVEVISRAHETIVGRYQIESDVGFVVADNPKIQQEVLVTPGRALDAKPGQFVEVKITHWPTQRFQPQGDIIEVIGNYMAPGMEIDVALRSFDIPHVWPEAVLKEAARLKPEVEEKDKQRRVDLRDLGRSDQVRAHQHDDEGHRQPDRDRLRDEGNHLPDRGHARSLAARHRRSVVKPFRRCV